jgi:hypothetical protein
MAATQLGLIKTQSPEGNTAITSEGVTHTITKTMPVDEAYDINTHTQATFPIEIMDSTLYIQSINIDRQPGQIAVVTYNYKSTAGVFPVGGVTGPSAVVGPQPSSRNLPRYEYDAVVEPISILRLSKFDKLDRADRRVLEAMIQLGPLDDDGVPRRDSLISDTGLAKEAADLIEDGIISKFAPSIVLRITHTDKTWGQAPVGAAKLGDLSSPDSLLAGSGLFDFILTGISASGNADGMDTFTETHQSAPFAENWDRRIYES